MRIGHLWFGADRLTTVSGISYFSDKKIQTYLPLRADAALALSKGQSPLDSIQVELVINYDNVAKHLQGLMAMIAISPVLPVMNPVVAVITQPVHLNTPVYESYGFNTELLTGDKVSFADTMAAYSGTPVSMNIDTVSIQSVGSRDLSIIVRMTRVLTSPSYGDCVRYVKTFNDALVQHRILEGSNQVNRENTLCEVIGEMIGVNNSEYQEMMRALQALDRPVTGEDTRTKARLVGIEDGDTITVVMQRDYDQKEPTVRTIRFFGIDTPESDVFYKAYDPENRTKVGPQKYGRAAKKNLEYLLKGGKSPVEVDVLIHDVDLYGRYVCEVFNSDGVNTNLRQVEAGLACAYSLNEERYNSSNALATNVLTKYQDAEETAKSKGIGMWADQNVEIPGEYRQRVKKLIALKYGKEIDILD